MRPSAFATLVLVLPPAAATQERVPPRFAGVFGDHMVLQRDRPLRLSGHAAAGALVHVSFGEQTAEARADARGEWTVTLPAQPADARGRDLVAECGATAVVRDVVVGDVWLCSGQSNMAMGLDACDDAAAIAAANDPLIRYRPYFEHFAAAPQRDLRDPIAWRVVTPATAGGCTAVGYWFAKTVRPAAGVPIGLLECTVGGTEIECWMPPAAFESDPDIAPLLAPLHAAVDAWQRDLQASLPSVEAWLVAARAAVDAGRPIPPAPRLPGHPNEDRQRWVRHTSLWNGMVHPLTSFPVRGALWYQGENNGGEGRVYAHKLTALVATWRRAFGAELPFYYVQLPGYGRPGNGLAAGDVGFAPCRMAQLECTRLPRVGMAVTIDCGDPDDIHPKDKRTVGERLARFALRDEYGQDVEADGPLFSAMDVGEGAVRVRFRGVGAGLVAGRLVAPGHFEPSPDAPLIGFVVAGRDGVWHEAVANIDGDAVVVRAAAVPSPVAVRYAYAACPARANLYNRDGLPASPFRSDGW